MKRRDIFFCIVLFIFGILSRLPFLERMQSHMDGPLYSIAVFRYSFEQSTPTAPGYPLYIGLAKLFFLVFTDPHNAILAVSVLFSGIGAVVFYLFGKSIFTQSTGIVAACIFLSSPSIYYFGVSGYAYIVVLVMTTSIAYCVYEIVFKKKQLSFLLGLLYALSLGVRPQELMLTLPLFIFGLMYLRQKERVIAVFSFLSVFFIWFFPFIILTGGLENFLYYSSEVSRNALPNLSLTYWLHKRFELASGVFLTLGVVLIFYLPFILDLVRKKQKAPLSHILKRKFILFSFTWFFPSLFFNTFIRTEHAGYQFNFLSYFIVLISVYISFLIKNRQVLVIVLTIIMACNLWLFFYDRDPERLFPYRQTSLHYSDLQRNDEELQSKVGFIKQNYLPDTSLLFSSTPFWSQYMYHLPEYTLYSVDGLFSADRRYASIIRKGRYWVRQESHTGSAGFLIPSTIKKIVILESDACRWKIHAGILRNTRDKNVCIVEIPVRPGQVYFFHYRRMILNE